MSEIARIRERLQTLGGAPGVADLQMMLTDLEGLLEAGAIALRVVDTHGGDLTAFHRALVELRALLKQVGDALQICERCVWEIRISRRAPATACERLHALLSAHRGTVDDLLWCLPRFHRPARGQA